jgi:N-formylmethionyl-tRNA deformylase
MYFMKDIVRDGDPVLRKVAADVKFPLSDEDKALAANMMEYLVKSQDEEYAEKHQLRAGVGLAAPQVGVSEMMAAVLVPNEEDPDKPLLKITLINPVIVRNSVQKAALSEGEGCLSVDKEYLDSYHVLIVLLLNMMILKVILRHYVSKVTLPSFVNMKLII